MKNFIFLFIFFIPFISFAVNNNEYCINSNKQIDKLINSNNFSHIYNYLSNNYSNYYNTCGNTKQLKSLVNKFVFLSEKNKFYNIEYSDYINILKLVRLSISDDEFQNSLKKSYINITNVIRDKLLIKENSSSNVDEKDFVYANDFLKNELDAKLAIYYQVDTNRFCQSDGEGTYICTYKYTYNKPLKLRGTLTVSNIYNHLNTDNPNYFKTSFKANNSDIDFSKLFVVPVNYKLNTKIPKNYLQYGAAGEIIFNVDFILDKDSFIERGNSTVGDINTIYVKDLNINSVKNIIYYDKSYIESYSFPEFIKTYELKANDNYTNIRDKPNGKIIYQIKFNDNDSSNNKIYFYEGYKEPGIDGYRLGYGYPPASYLYNYYKILGFSKPVSNYWYFITYFPKNSSKPVFGYIHSSEIIFDNNLDNAFESVDNIENINTLTYKQIFDILHNIIGEDVYIIRKNYCINNKFQSLIDKYVSILLSNTFTFNTRDFSYDMNFINSLYYYISDDIYYKIIDKYIKDSVKFNKIDKNKTKIVGDKYIYKLISPKYVNYFKQILSKSELEYNLDIYGITDVNKYINSLEIENAIYTFNSTNPVKITGKVIFNPASYSPYSFIPDDFIITNNELNLYPLNYSVNKEVYNNLFSAGYQGIVSFDGEITLSKKSLLEIYNNNLNLFVDNLIINRVDNLRYFDNIFYSESSKNVYTNTITYTVSSKMGFAELLDSPNGKVIASIKNSSKIYLTSIILPDNTWSFYDLWFYITNYKPNISGKYYRVIYFPDGVTDGCKALSGYIYSSNIKKVDD